MQTLSYRKIHKCIAAANLFELQGRQVPTKRRQRDMSPWVMPGKYTNMRGQHRCKLCPNGKYKMQHSRNVPCMLERGDNCWKGWGFNLSTMPFWALKTGLVCDSCPTGTYRGSDDSATLCIQCPAGWEASKPGSQDCSQRLEKWVCVLAFVSNAEVRDTTKIAWCNICKSESWQDSHQK